MDWHAYAELRSSRPVAGGSWGSLDTSAARNGANRPAKMAAPRPSSNHLDRIKQRRRASAKGLLARFLEKRSQGAGAGSGRAARSCRPLQNSDSTHCWRELPNVMRTDWALPRRLA